MSKKQQNTNGDEPLDFITTSGGEKIYLLGINPGFLQRIQTAGTLPSVPYRELETAFGESEKDELREDDLQNEEEREQWKKYTDERNAVLSKRHTNFIKAIFAKGTKVDEAKLAEWKKEQVEFWEAEVPDNPIDLKVEYLQDLLSNNPDDTMGLVLGVLEKTGIPEKEMEAIRAMFRSASRRDTVKQS